MLKFIEKCLFFHSAEEESEEEEDEDADDDGRTDDDDEDCEEDDGLLHSILFPFNSKPHRIPNEYSKFA